MGVLMFFSAVTMVAELEEDGNAGIFLFDDD